MGQVSFGSMFRVESARIGIGETIIVGRILYASGVPLIILDDTSYYHNHNAYPLVIIVILRSFASTLKVPTGLPPIHGIEHQIDLIPGVPLPKRPPYRTNP